ncbi:DNA mobilization endonuclease VirD1/MobC family subunit [Rhizobium sp. NFACC06-2]|uniref:DNA mobilization endonuclease VirD1/MobC family subunit n=1 Tax=Rhizobium sp. NFACC06-2 TaxID=1566264 RepID=UPI000876A44D|nr:DNA mobilization endonuclease VirD1/MobC family subunit [Rhizobium sp. NFACC06-2]SCY90393.1 type IV secretion system T-DNA border endonuclease VirD1 [Rhizobium sp. NFACC06-2]
MSYKEPMLLPEEVATTLVHGRKQPSDLRGYKIVSVRLREAEFEAFAEQASALGLSSNMALRIAARRIGGFLEVNDGTQDCLEEMLRAIGDISRNISDLNDSYTKSGKVDMKEFEALHASFGYKFARLDATLMSMLNIARRRLDGKLQLRDAAKA